MPPAAIATKTNASGFCLPVLGLGTWGMGGRAEHDAQNDDAKDIAAIQMALAGGITHIDTAEFYAAGHSETLVGKAIADFPRQDILLATKVYGTNLAQEDVLASCTASLQRLGTEYLDLYYIHYRNPEIPLAQTARALNELLRQGRITAIGVCNFSVQSMSDLQALLDAPIAVNQSHYSLVYREPARAGLLDHCAKVGALFVAWRPLLWKLPNRDGQPAGSAWDRGVYPLLDEISDRTGKTNVQVALNWLITQPNIATLVKTTRPDHLRELLGCLGWELSSEDRAELTAHFPEQRNISGSVPLV